MRSKASFKSHPIHPILIVFPIAFFTGTFIADIVYLFRATDTIKEMTRYLNIAAIGSALLAAVPGIIDYTFTVPPESSAKKRASSHALLNSTTIVLFTIVLFQRHDLSQYVILALDAIGMITLTIAGWHGGTLVYRNQIGVDPRYADAGKWNEAYVKDSLPALVATTDELKVNQMKLIHINDKRIVIANAGNGYVAFDDRCPHKGGSLAGGSMMCGTVQCPWHGSQFDVHNGSVTAGPSDHGIATYKVQEKDGKIYLLSVNQ